MAGFVRIVFVLQGTSDFTNGRLLFNHLRFPDNLPKGRGGSCRPVRRDTSGSRIMPACVCRANRIRRRSPRTIRS